MAEKNSNLVHVVVAVVVVAALGVAALAGSYKTAFGAQQAIGPEDAAVLVFIMSDFQCPVCKRAAE